MTKRLFALMLVTSVACSTSNGGSGSGGSGTGGSASGGSGTGGASSSGGATPTGGSATGGAIGTTGGKGGSTTATGGSTPNGGSKGTGGAPATGGSAGGSGPVDTDNNVLERNKHASRDGHFVQATLTKANAAKMAIDAGFAATFTGDMWASPLYFENGPGGKGIFIAVTLTNDVYALDETTGATVWKTNIGAPATGMIGCGSFTQNPSSVGILSTPVIDGPSSTLYVAGGIGNAQGVSAQILTAIDLMTGKVKTGWPVDLTAKLSFEPKLHIQRSSLSLVNGIVYIGYGGYIGDCGNYHGRVVAVKASDPTQVAGWAAGGQAEGIWPAGGMASDGTSVFAVTGNVMPRTSTSRVHSESVFRISGMATANDKAAKDFFTPSNFASMDSNDADLSSSNTVYFKVPGATPSALVGAFSKDGNMFLLDATNLGGMGKEVSKTALSTGAMSLFATPTVYQTPTGTFVAVSTDGGAQCPSGGGAQVMGISISAASPPTGKAVWCAAAKGGTAAISTTTDGQTDPIVWVLNSGKLYSYEGETGKMISNGGSGSCSSVVHWTSPIAVKGRIIVGGSGHLCSWSAQ